MKKANVQWIRSILCMTGMMMIFKLIQVLLPVILLEKIWYYVNNRRLAFGYSLLVLTAALIVMTEANANTIFLVISLTVLIFHLYPNFTKKYAK